MFSAYSEENKWEYVSDWLLHRSGKSEILCVRVSFVLLFHALPPFPCSDIPHPCQALSLCLLPERDAPSACPWPMWAFASITAWCGNCSCWELEQPGQLPWEFLNNKYRDYHCWIHTQTANKHPHSSPPRKDVITPSIIFTVECCLFMGKSSGWHSEGTSLNAVYFKHNEIIVISKAGLAEHLSFLTLSYSE